ncbi:MAG: GAF domain-containing protein [Thermoleophilia bacterium]|nr:GAF domain-containing protein [Thermoleophilia bacterium]
MREVGSEPFSSQEQELRDRLRELAAVYRMSETALAAEALDAILDRAVDTLVDAVGVDRASVLLFDEDGVLRLRAGRGLSDEYRAAVEGHSPWRGDEGEYAPIAVADVNEDTAVGGDLRRTIAAEGIRSLAFVPLVQGRELLGKLMLYRDDVHEFTPAELKLAQTIASTLASAVQRARVEQALRESSRRLDVVFRHVADGLTVQDPTGKLVFANDAAAHMSGFASAEELMSTPPAEILARYELIDERGEPLGGDDLPGRLALRGAEGGSRVIGWRSRDTGEERWSLVSATSVRDDEGRLEFVINVVRDVTDRRRQEQRLSVLARAGEVLAESLDVERTLAEVAQLAVPAVGDWCMVYVEDAEGQILRIAVEHRGSRGSDVLARLDDHSFRPDADVGVPAVIRTGRSELHSIADSALVAADVVDGERLAAELADLGIRSWMCVPLTARARTFGAMAFLSAESGRRFDQEDLAVAEELARRAAVAIDNARLYHEAQRSYAQLDAILASAPTAIGFWDRDIRYVRVNEALARLNGLPAEEHVGKSLWDVVPDLAPVLEPVYRGVVESGTPLVRHEASTDLGAHRLGTDRHWLSSYFPVETETGEVLGIGAVVMEITERKQAEDMAAVRARQQSDVAELGQLALTGTDVVPLAGQAAQRISKTLGVDFVEVLELLPGEQLLLIEGSGWNEGHVGSTTVPWGKGSQAGFTLEAKGPVNVEDLAGERRFKPSPLLREHGVTSGLTVMIPGPEEPFGVLGAHTASRRAFSVDDVTYVQAVANVLGAAAQQQRLAQAEQRARERLGFLAEASRLLAASLDYEETLQAVSELAGTEIADWISVYLADEEGRVRRILGRHPDPEKNALVEEITEHYSLPVDERHPVHVVIRDGESLLTADVTDEMLAAAAVDERHLELLRGLGIRSGIVVPIRAGSEIAGAIGFVRAQDPPYTQDDLRLAVELARRAGLAIENARLFRSAEAARREAEARAESAQALEFVGDGVFLLDRGGTVRLWNPAAEAITGLSAESVVGQAAVEAIPGWAELAPRVPIVGVETGAAGARPQTLPLELGGRELWLSISGVGFEHGTVFAFRDVTEERAVEKLKTDFVSTISHELRTPLAAIYGAALTLRRQDMPPDQPERVELLSVIASESERLARIVNDILWTSRIESGGLQVTVEACDGAELATAVVRAAELQLPENLTLRLEVPGGLPPVLADADKVRQVLTNLVENAVKYSPDGGTVEVRLEHVGDRVRFAVRDEGLGIPSQEWERIFEKFYRLDPNLTRGVGGTGLGLYISRELVGRMGGTIRLEESDQASGSTFVVELPAAGEVLLHGLTA